jgi:Phage integrase family
VPVEQVSLFTEGEPVLTGGPECIEQPVLDVVLGHVAKDPERRLLAVIPYGLRRLEVVELISGLPSSKAYTTDNLNEAAGLGHVTFHELRHTAAALMIDQGDDPLQVQRRLGHANVSTTLGRYGHLFPNREDDLNERLESLFQSARSVPDVAPMWPQTSESVSDIGG